MLAVYTYSNDIYSLAWGVVLSRVIGLSRTSKTDNPNSLTLSFLYKPFLLGLGKQICDIMKRILLFLVGALMKLSMLARKTLSVSTFKHSNYSMTHSCNLGLLLILLTVVGCNSAQYKEKFKHYDKVLVGDYNGQIRDIGIMMNISQDTTEQFRISFAGTDSVDSIVYWVKQSAIERTTSIDAHVDRYQKFNSLVKDQYVYKGTALRKSGVHLCAMVISATPLEDYVVGKKIPKEELISIKNCIYFETNDAHVDSSYVTQTDYVYPQNNENLLYRLFLNLSK